MTQPFVGEIRMFGGNFAPLNWMFCNGQTIPIAGNETLYNLIGTMYGGDGQTNFALPDLRGRLPVHFGAGFIQAQSGGFEEVMLNTNQIPQHDHPVVATTTSLQTSPSNNFFATAAGTSGVQPLTYSTANPDVTMSPRIVSPAGGNQPHSNLQPYLCLSFIIALYGIYPQQS